VRLDELVNSALPPTWNIGIGLSSTSSGPMPAASKASRALLVSPRWVSTALLGLSVVPEV
jgi:hypothetical protein